jgi:hypothetical protein
MIASQRNDRRSRLVTPRVLRATPTRSAACLDPSAGRFRTSRLYGGTVKPLGNRSYSRVGHAALRDGR